VVRYPPDFRLRLPANAMCCPSGDHAGSDTRILDRVSRRRPRPSLRMTSMPRPLVGERDQGRARYLGVRSSARSGYGRCTCRSAGEQAAKRVLDSDHCRRFSPEAAGPRP
jgi:hypothetical protein